MPVPSAASFLTFVRNVMGVPAAYLPDSSPYLTWAFDQALAIVNSDLALSPPARSTSPPDPTIWSVYELAVYNLSAHNLIEFAPDQSYSISAAAWARSFVTLTTGVTNFIAPGDKLSVSGISPNSYNSGAKLYVAESIVDPTHLTYGLSPNPGAVVSVAGAVVSETYFAQLRKLFKIGRFVPGIVTSTSDLSTSVGLTLPDFLRNLTLYDLALMTTPFGRKYLEIASKYGKSIWGIT